jgi:hypothetical protein
MLIWTVLGCREFDQSGGGQKTCVRKGNWSIASQAPVDPRQWPALSVSVDANATVSNTAAAGAPRRAINGVRHRYKFE